MQGTKIWEVDVHSDVVEGSTRSRIVDISWSPDNLHIAAAHHPPLVTLHSIQDGREERKLDVTKSIPGNSQELTHIWWYKEHRKETKPGIPDIFKRQDIITGSAHSILKTQPLLDALPDDSDRLSSADLFAFSRTRTATPASDSLPQSISSWPTLPQDLLLASIQPRSTASKNNKRPGEELDEVDSSNINSILYVCTVSSGAQRDDGECRIYAWLDGSYPLGSILLPHPVHSINQLNKMDNMTYFIHPSLLAPSSGYRATTLHPLRLSLPSMAAPLPRRVAQTASSTRALTWYILRVVKELRDAWFGTSANPGARMVGQNWVQGLERRQRSQFGLEEPNGLLDLTVLLATGRASESVSDYLGSGEQMSERGLQKWENTVVDALFKFRDYANRRVARAFQRMHILLQEVQGWVQLPQYAYCQIDIEQVNASLDLAARGIICATWLASTARLELRRFREFMAWIKYESNRATNLHNDTYTPPPPKHDILDVSAYLERGLVASTLDRWFLGPTPKFPLKPSFGLMKDLPVQKIPIFTRALQGERERAPEIFREDVEVAKGVTSGKKQCLDEVLRKARQKLGEERNGLTWPPDTLPPDLSSLDRNLDALAVELAQRCSNIFQAASCAVTRAAELSPVPEEIEEVDETRRPKWLRERTRLRLQGPDLLLQLWAAFVPPAENQIGYLCLFKTVYDSKSSRKTTFAVMTCEVEDEDGAVTPVELLDAEYFDDAHIVAVFRSRIAANAESTLAMVRFIAVKFYEIQEAQTKEVSTREALIDRVLRLAQSGAMPSTPLRVVRSRTLAGCVKGSVALAANGRKGRRVVCVLGEDGTALQVFDMEGEEDEGEEDEEAEAVSDVAEGEDAE
ncbi:uncharacterized protein PHACADRAFT_261151 [Phanerochaete carnosa HHB-10118-sp]|uniref:Anaphase-promoting complex subunit 4 n=1 Tax=Phanerochaete carnosa (strain HHB-10118-sp) TaxID=650164 RepID=K5W133_PHACS|nr:uncharacterized protein PHACADRAFT_261151 [Phanerochaete carnosa HHB-10118-sp]EKM52609.1 hypothetical protein PHACADRAFT_261151 [Phanerochaete carnosa HHB-10118-sp]